MVPEEPQPDPVAHRARADQARRDKTRDTAAVRAHRKPDLIEPLPLTNPDGVSSWKEPFFGQYEPRAQSAHVLGFEHDPQQALYGFWALSGQGQGNHTKPLNGFPDLIPDPLSREAELTLLHAGAAAMNCYQPHVGCAACGIRVVGYENTDPRGDGIPNEKFSRVPITDGKFQRVFQATISTLDLEASFPEEYRCVVSVYRPAHIADCPPLSVYEKYVHNDLATLCAKCAVAYKSSGTTPYSLVCGMNFGDASKLGLKKPTLSEKMVIARCRSIAYCLKIVASDDPPKGMPKLKGHVACCPHDAPNEFCNILPRCDLGGILTVYFVGSRNQYEQFSKDGTLRHFLKSVLEVLLLLHLPIPFGKLLDDFRSNELCC